jgi:hypothetical protein
MTVREVPSTGDALGVIRRRQQETECPRNSKRDSQERDWLALAPASCAARQGGFRHLARAGRARGGRAGEICRFGPIAW